MSFGSIIVRGFVASFLIFSLSMLAFADTIRLKDGSIIKGKIVSFGNGKFVVSLGSGSRQRQLTFTAAEIESIQFDLATDAPRLSNPNRTAGYKPPFQNGSKAQYEKVTRTEDGDRVRPTPKVPGEEIQPIQWNIKVLADNTANGWTNSGWVVKKGQRIRIAGDGKISLGKGQNSTPSGVASLNDDAKLLKSVPTGALIAVIGDDNNDFIYVGGEREFTATRDGALFLGINENYLEDNSGSFDVKIEILPDDLK